MAPRRVPRRVPHPPGLDHDTTDRLLEGRIGPDDAPPGYEEVAALLSTLHSTADGEASIDRVGAVAALTNRTPVASPVRAIGRWSRRATAVTLGALVLSGAVGAAAATGVIPGIVDDTPIVTTTLTPGAGGVDQPDGGNGRPSDSPDPGGSGTDGTTTEPGASSTTVAGSTSTSVDGATPVGPDPTGAARQGLCQAFGARTELPGKSVAAANLRAAASAAGQTVAEFCGDTTTTSAGSTTTAPGRSGSAPGQTGTTTPPGNSGSAPGQTASTPGQAGTQPPGQAGAAPGQPKSTTTVTSANGTGKGNGNGTSG